MPGTAQALIGHIRYHARIGGGDDADWLRMIKFPVLRMSLC